MKTSEQTAEIAAALSKAQADLKNPKRDRTVKVKTRTGGSYEFSYATLDSILSHARPILAKHGLAISQAVDGETVVSRLMHSSGEWLESATPLFVEGSGPQAFGSAVTYARRYGMSGLLGITSEEDDDGNRAEGNEAKPKASPKPKQPEPDYAEASAIASQIINCDSAEDLQALGKRIADSVELSNETKAHVRPLFAKRMAILAPPEVNADAL